MRQASLIQRNSVGLARISLVRWWGPNYNNRAEATNELCFCWLSFKANIWCSPRQDPQPQTPISCRVRNQPIPDCFRFGLIETLAYSLHGCIPIPGPSPSPSSQGGLMELQAFTTRAIQKPRIVRRERNGENESTIVEAGARQ